ncbi:MAG TPA: HAMP domain-containing sensor histidine kinase [Thermoanaerobaculia bacterium]|nr:HAMP domain-containing sensor histidine kinase [Thermoanaerobaculia bacterium]
MEEPELRRYGGAILGWALAILIRLLADPLLGDSYPYTTLYFAVVATAWLAGFGPALLATVLGAAAGAFLFVQPRFSFAIDRGQDLFGLTVFVALGLMTAALSRRAEQARQLGVEVDKRRKSEEALLETARRKDDFIAILAHELRNPLAPIRNAVQILSLAENDPRALRKAREILERQVRQMVRLVDDLLDVSRIGHGKIEIRRERVRVSEVVRTALEISRPHIEKAGHQLKVELPPLDPELDADPARLAQVLSNLLGNAAKYMEPGGCIRLSVCTDDEFTVIRVRDEGIGIPAELLDRIFEPFVQVDGSLNRSQGGLGIGLALVRSLVSLHGGTVTAHSDGLGTGSELVVRLPAAT